MDLQLDGKHVLISGGSRGIGYACAEEFLREGCTVSLVGRDADRLEQACAKLDPERTRVHGFAADATDAARTLAVIDRIEASIGPVDVLVNAAGGARQKPFAELQPHDWKAGIEAKFLTYMNMMDPLVKRMAARGRGAVVNIVGMGGKLPITTHLPGGSANAALMLASAGLAMAYAPQGVRINAINPAKTATDRFLEGVEADARQRNVSIESALAAANAALPGGRIAMPADIAAAAVFLASPRAGYISGVILCIDGGLRPMVV
jgi:NAD(P)-dependent dehydrogenase (short-subunit alcohol dehydrogenase family)